MTAEQRPRLLGAALMVASVLFFVVMNSLTKYSDAPAAEKVFFRMLVGLFAVFALVRAGWVKMEFNNIPLLALRGFLGAIAVMFYFDSIDHTTLGRAVFFQFTYPAWGALFSYIFLKESLGWKRLPGLLITFAGGYMILASDGAFTLAGMTRGDVSGVLCGLFSGAAVTTIRACHRHDATYMIFLFFASFGTLAGALFTFPGHFVEPTRMGWLVLACIGVTGTIAQLFFTQSYRYLDVAAAGSMATLQAPLSALMGWIFFREEFGEYAMVGGLLVIAGGVFLALTSRGETLTRPECAAAPPSK
jgi:drug/metabolite transporter (DMT)-like permease